MINHSQSQDLLDRFIFEDLPIRGERVYLKNIWKELQLRRKYPENVKRELGELLATTALLAATIKIEGKLTVQIEATGPLNLMVVQVSHLKGMRAVARYDQEGVKGLEGLEALCGEGRIVITIDAPIYKQPYQGVIPLMDASISEAIERYFETSEQLESRIYLATSEEAVSGLFIQRLPGESPDEDAFNRITQLANTVKADELLTLETSELLHRLYSTDDIRLFDPDKFHYECNCSKERSLSMLYQFEREEIEEILAEREGTLYVDCEFCGKRYLFEEKDLDLDLCQTKH